MVKYAWVFIFNFKFQFLVFIFSFCYNLKLSFVVYIAKDFTYSMKAKTVEKFQVIYSETIHHTVISNVINHESLFEKYVNRFTFGHCKKDLISLISESEITTE